jgi:hypothetical protein
MSRAGSLLLILLAALALSDAASAQSLRMRTQAPVTQKEDESPWDVNLRYGMVTDYADTNQPRGYLNELILSTGYKFNKTWSVNTEIGGVAEFFDGQIDKKSEQSYDESLHPTTNVELDYDGKINNTHTYSFNVHGEPLWDEASRLEGYKALYGAGADLNLKFFHKAYTFGNLVDVTELHNTYYYGSDLTPNPDYFITYKLTNSLKFLGSWKIAYIFGFKSTRYLDNFWGYTYENTVKLSKSFGKVTAALSYLNGGFTDDGTLSLWYIDRYRSVAKFGINYEF